MFLPQEIARHLQEKEAMKLERARQKRIERQLREEREQKMLHEAISGLQEHTENHVNHHEQTETQRGVCDSLTIFQAFINPFRLQFYISF